MNTDLLKFSAFFILLTFNLLMYPQKIDWSEVVPYDSNPPEVQWGNPTDTVYSSKFELVLEVTSNYPIEMVRTSINGQKIEEWRNLFRPEDAEETKERASELIAKGRSNYKIIQPYYLYKDRISDGIAILELSLQAGTNNIEVEVMNQGKAVNTSTFQVYCDYKVDEYRPVLHLLTVGVGKYEMDDIQTLNYPAKDAKAIDSVFVNQKSLYREIKKYHLTDSAATKEAIESLIEEVRKSVREDDVIVAFFSGHGDQTHYDSSEEIRFMPFNFDHGKKAITGISVDYVSHTIANMPCNSLIIFDACHSGRIFSNGLVAKSSGARKAVKVKVKRRLNKNKNQSVVLTASAEEAFEHPDWKHGALTIAILEALGNEIDTRFMPDYSEGIYTSSRNGKRLIMTPQLLQEITADELIDAQELLRYVNSRVPEIVRNQEGEQHPVFKGKGDFFIYQLNDK